ncbi:arsenite efflux transporter metallochaperone ArsD [Armatimonas sp.]|uniref:arsenite efflux transporter metallochaperone ArsD n=1 Tax=Armatimonas sp. TaxID=1872638 RepID=UPI0037505BB2
MSVKIQVFDPPMCCSTGVCGPSIDPALVRIGSDLSWLKEQGVTVERANLSQDMAAFAASSPVIAELEADPKALPLVLVGGEVKSRKSYPTREQLAAWCGLELSHVDG